MKKIFVAALFAFVSVNAMAADCAIDWPPESPDNQYHLNK
nr:Shiga toxin II subunit B [Escherichia coli]